MRVLIPSLVITALIAVPAGSHPGPEQHPSWADRVPTFDSPIAGIRNNYWDDYRSDIAEAESELRKDLRRATDAEDERDAWREYVRELEDAAEDYAGEMAERGYRQGLVTVGD